MQPLSFKERVLIFLAERGGFTNSLKMTTPILSKYLGTSQQSASRLLITLEREGLLERRIVGRTTYVKITPIGVARLRDLYISLKTIFERPVNIVLEGRVFTGLGEGAYYMSQPGYVKQMEEKLGYTPYPGTLNLSLLSRDSIENRLLLQKLAFIEIQGFKDGLRTFGNVKIIPATINENIKGGIIFAERSHYDNSVIELISHVRLRDELNLKDGSLVKVSVEIPSNNFFENFRVKPVIYSPPP
ncbi:hypothetical protein HRbin01_00387 [archaeon HR01]|nr:hypothetical protein HRbin01_00387 [archaeon HR01]